MNATIYYFNYFLADITGGGGKRPLFPLPPSKREKNRASNP